MDCQELREGIADYLISALDEAAQSEFQAHLSQCTACREEVESLRALWAHLQLLPAEQPSPALRVRFYAALEAYKHGLEQTGPAGHAHSFGAPSPWAFLWPRLHIAQLAFAALLMAVGFTVGYFARGERIAGNGSTELAQLREEVRSMQQVVTLSLLQTPSASERLAGLTWSSRIQRPDSRVLAALLSVLDSDPDVNVRLAAVDALYPFADLGAVRQTLMGTLTRQPSPLVQIAVIDMLVAIKEKQSVEALRKLLNDQGADQAVKQRAEWGVQQLS